MALHLAHACSVLFATLVSAVQLCRCEEALRTQCVTQGFHFVSCVFLQLLVVWSCTLTPSLASAQASPLFGLPGFLIQACHGQHLSAMS